MTSENTPYVTFLKNEDFLKTLKERFENAYGESLKSITYTYIAHVKPDKVKVDIDREFYVVFTLNRGKLEYSVVYDTKPKKLKVGWIWSAEPANWRKFIETTQFKPLKKIIKYSQFQRINIDAINQITNFLFGMIVAISRNNNFIEGAKPLESPKSAKTPESEDPPEPEREIKPPEQLKKEIETFNERINDEGWNPTLSRKLAWNYFDLGDLDKAETEFFKYFDETKDTDIPAFIFCKIAAVKAENLELMMGGSDIPDHVISSLSKEELMEMYEEGKKKILKNFQ